MLIYKTLGDSAQKEFAKVRPFVERCRFLLSTCSDALGLAQTWGVGYSLNNISEWQEVFKTAAKTALVLVVLDLLRVTKDRPWFEVRRVWQRRMHAASSDAWRRSTWTSSACRPRCSAALRAAGGARRGGLWRCRAALWTIEPPQRTLRFDSTLRTSYSAQTTRCASPTPGASLRFASTLFRKPRLIFPVSLTLHAVARPAFKLVPHKRRPINPRAQPASGKMEGTGVSTSRQESAHNEGAYSAGDDLRSAKETGRRQRQRLRKAFQSHGVCA